MTIKYGQYIIVHIINKYNKNCGHRKIPGGRNFLNTFLCYPLFFDCNVSRETLAFLHQQMKEGKKLRHKFTDGSLYIAI